MSKAKTTFRIWCEPTSLSPGQYWDGWTRPVEWEADGGIFCLVENKGEQIERGTGFHIVNFAGGVEIFENDLLESPSWEGPAAVIWSARKSRWQLEGPKFFADGIDVDFLSRARVKIVGTTHDENWWGRDE